MNKNKNQNFGKLGDGVKVDLAQIDDIPEEERKRIFDREASVDAIPDLDILTGHVYDILNYLMKPEVKKLIRTNESAVKMHLNEKYADTVPLGIITLLMEEDKRVEHVEMLLKMFTRLKDAKAGKISIEDAEKNLTDEVNQKYLYSKYGSKEAFERALASEVQKERKKQTNDNLDIVKNIGKVSIKN